MRKKHDEKENINARDNLIIGIQIGAYTILYFAMIWIFISKYEVIVIRNNSSIWDIVHQEFPNLFSIIPFLVPFVVGQIVKLINKRTTIIYRVLWGIIMAILIIFYRIAVDVELHRVIIGIVGIGVYILMLALSLLYSNSPQDKTIVTIGRLYEVIGPIRNKNILCVQLFRCSKTVADNFVNISFHNIDYLSNGQNEDVNSILSISMNLPKEDYEQFNLSLYTYGLVIEEGDEGDKAKLIESIREAKQALLQKLNAVPVEKVSKTDCCLARLLLCYTLLERKMVEPTEASLDLDDGESGIKIELEKRMLAFFRSGMLGAYLFGKEDRYYFRYRRDGMKVGRKYCAFLLETPHSDVDIMCLITIRENNTTRITNDIIDWINRQEKKMLKNIPEIIKEGTI